MPGGPPISSWVLVWPAFTWVMMLARRFSPWGCGRWKVSGVMDPKATRPQPKVISASAAVPIGLPPPSACSMTVVSGEEGPRPPSSRMKPWVKKTESGSDVNWVPTGRNGPLKIGWVGSTAWPPCEGVPTFGSKTSVTGPEGNGVPQNGRMEFRRKPKSMLPPSEGPAFRKSFPPWALTQSSIRARFAARNAASSVAVFPLPSRNTNVAVPRVISRSRSAGTVPKSAATSPDDRLSRQRLRHPSPTAPNTFVIAASLAVDPNGGPAAQWRR
jgi:hypothetical protein